MVGSSYLPSLAHLEALAKTTVLVQHGLFVAALHMLVIVVALVFVCRCSYGGVLLSGQPKLGRTFLLKCCIRFAFILFSLMSDVP